MPGDLEAQAVAGGEHGEEDAGHEQILRKRTNALASGSELNDSVEGKVSEGDGDDRAAHAVKRECHVDADDDSEAVAGVSDGVVFGLAKRKEDRCSGLVEQRVP